MRKTNRTPAPLARYRELDIDPSTHLILDYDHKQIYVDRARTNPPRLQGVSGGGVFRLRIDTPPKLVGIPTDHLKTRRVIVATKIRCVIARIRTPFHKTATEAPAEAPAPAVEITVTY